MKIALIANRSLRDYVLNTFAVHPEFDAEIVCLPAWKEADFTFYRDIPAVPVSQLHQMQYDTVLFAVRNLNRVLTALPALLLPTIQGEAERDFFLIRPSALRTGADFISGQGFDARYVDKLPASGAALNVVAGMIPRYVHAREAAKQIFTASDSIEAYEEENIYVKITPWVGYTYTSDGNVLDSCFNAARYVYQRLFDEMEKSTELIFDADRVYGDTQVCILTRSWTMTNYYHFMCEVCDKILIAEKLGFQGKYMLFHIRFAEEYLALLGVAPERVIWVEREDFGKVFLIRRAFDVEGFSVGRKKGLPILNEFSDRVVSKLMSDEERKRYPRRLYVKRIGRRKLLDVEDVLEKYGFVPMVPEEHSIEEEIKFFHYADIVISPHGAATRNALFMRENTALIETLPNQWIKLAHFDIITLRNLIYRQIVEPFEDRPNADDPQWHNYRVDNRVLDCTLKELAERFPLD